MTHARAALFALALAGCSSAGSPVHVDDVTDSGADLDADDGADAGPVLADAAPVDAPSVDAFRPPIVDAGPAWTCSVVPQDRCPIRDACRLSIVAGTTPGNGPPECVPAGPAAESSIGCRVSGVDQCRAGFFCGNGFGCVRYCDPAGDPCPPLCAGGRGCVQRCNTADLIAGNPLGLGFCQLAL